MIKGTESPAMDWISLRWFGALRFNYVSRTLPNWCFLTNLKRTEQIKHMNNGPTHKQNEWTCERIQTQTCEEQQLISWARLSWCVGELVVSDSVYSTYQTCITSDKLRSFWYGNIAVFIGNSPALIWQTKRLDGFCVLKPDFWAKFFIFKGI